ncbi:MAG: VWA domain-containing protein [Thermoanaerobaculia bacterium]
MRRSVLWLLLTGLVAPAVAAEPAIFLDYPLGLEFVSGPVKIEASVVSEDPVRIVEFQVDGKPIVRFDRPPYRAFVDVGWDNVEHEFTAILRTENGVEVSTSVRTPKLKVDDELDVELMQLYLTATEAGRRRLDLDRADFKIVDDGDEQEIVTFERGDIPVTAVLLLDCSLSMKGGRLAAALAGARVFLDEMAELDRASLLLFSDRMLDATQYSEQAGELEPALTGVVAAGGTSINDHLFLTLQDLEREQGRRAIVLFSDGADVHSVLGMQAVFEKARRSSSLIYWIYLSDAESVEDVPSYASSWRGVDRNKEEFRLLRKTVLESGGRIQIVHDPEQLGGAFKTIVDELRGQYVLGYYPSNRRHDGSWHRVRVRVRDSAIDLRTRDGYTDW